MVVYVLHRRGYHDCPPLSTSPSLFNGRYSTGRVVSALDHKFLPMKPPARPTGTLQCHGTATFWGFGSSFGPSDRVARLGGTMILDVGLSGIKPPYTCLDAKNVRLCITHKCRWQCCQWLHRKIVGLHITCKGHVSVNMRLRITRK